MRVLLLGNTRRDPRSLARSLRRSGFAVDEIRSLNEAREAIDETQYDCLILDRNLPDGDAAELAVDLHAGADRPAIFMVVRDEAGRVECLTAGADDAMVKPLSVEELILRVRKLIVRRTPGGPWVQLGDVSIDRSRGIVCIADEPVHLSPLQYSVFEQLAIHAGRVVKHDWLLEHCWDSRRDPFANALHSLLTRLRHIFRGHIVIEPVRGLGYVLRLAPDVSGSSETA